MEAPMTTEPTKNTHLDFLAGTHIRAAAQALVEAAPSSAEFNSVRIAMSVGMASGDIVAHYDREMTARSEAWRNSPEGKAAEARSLVALEDAQRKVDAGVATLGRMAFGDIGHVLAWWEGMVEPLDRVGVECDRVAIVATFVRHGYEPGVYCDAAFVADNREIHARWIIGQCLDGVTRMGAPHCMALTFIAGWRTRFEGEHE